MPRIILISGTPGTGKTTIAAELDDGKTKIFNQLDLAIELDCIDGRDDDRDALIIDDNLLHEKLKKWIPEQSDNIIIEGHIADLIPKKYLEHCFILDPPIEILRPRLEQRGYSEFKISENIEAHIMKECYYDAIEYYGQNKVTEITSIDKETIVSIIKNKF